MKIDISNMRPSTPQAPPESGQSGIMALLNKDIQLFGGGFNDKKKERFYSELTILFSSGLDIKTILELIEAEQKKEKEKELFRTIKNDVLKGSTLSDALRSTGKFTDYEYHSVKIGEETGKLTEVLVELCDYFNRKIKQKRQIVSALTYPVIVVSFAFLITIMMLKYLVPLFGDIFARFNAELPTLTKYTIKASNVVNQYALYVLLFFALIGFFIYRNKQKPWFRKHASRLLLRLPIVGSFIQKVYITRFCQTMGLLISARTNLIDALQLTKNMLSFYPIEETIGPITEQIMKGKPFYVCLQQFPIYNHRMVSLIKVAEEVNQLDTMFSRLAKQYSDEIDHESKVISNLLEPFIIIFLGVVVSTILISMYLPLFQLSTVIK
ncbi:MAG: type II secretion system F family protein [Bacteroidetes bacterium]|nr:type II secretion system F family protein [Bacteroidota bacterium]